jgi:hypothetical protein
MQSIEAIVFYYFFYFIFNIKIRVVGKVKIRVDTLSFAAHNKKRPEGRHLS